MMSLVVYKYPIDSGMNFLVIPGIGDIISAKVKNGVPWVWALVDTERDYAVASVLVLCTGVKMPEYVDEHEFIDTIMLNDDTIVWHVFRCNGLCKHLTYNELQAHKVACDLAAQKNAAKKEGKKRQKHSQQEGGSDAV